jgi:two-component system, chemotaxis family, protein-glutamate methylesterase/glutaminase
MPQAIRVLVVDDSVVIRRVLCNALASDPAVEVVGTAADGRIALEKIAQLKPDLVTLDVEMPVLSGLEAIPEIRKLYPRLPVIMFSTLTDRGAATTLEALSLGASDYVTKPSNTGSLDVTLEKIKQDLLPKIKALCWRVQLPGKLPAPRITKPGCSPYALAPGLTAALSHPGVAPPAAAALPRHGGPIDILAIGTSTGGPNALADVLSAIPGDFSVPIVIVQHMPALFTRTLAERLGRKAAISVREGEPGAKLCPGQAWIAPGDYHMTVERYGREAILAMNQGPAENSCRPAVDVLFRSVAAVFGAGTLAVVLTGMGSDGVLGSQAVRMRGGRVLVQDEASSVVWGMPGQVAAGGWADAIFPLCSIASEIDRQVRACRLFTRENSRLLPS